VIPSSLGQASATVFAECRCRGLSFACEGPLSGVRNLIVIACGLALIAFGFVSLAAGSITLAPILLVAGYCVVIPVGIILGVRDGRRNPRGSGETGGE
jgi:hypothetical protein